MGSSGMGYEFSAGINYIGNGSEFEPEKILYFDFRRQKFDLMADAVTKLRGENEIYKPSVIREIGDERCIGSHEEISDTLVGWDGLGVHISLDHQIYVSSSNLKKVRDSHLYVYIHNDNLGTNTTGKADLKVLKTQSLREVCQTLFMDLNKDEEIDLQRHFPVYTK